jgi:hypothetical protein
MILAESDRKQQNVRANAAALRPAPRCHLSKGSDQALVGLGPSGFHRLGIPYAFYEAQGIGEGWALCGPVHHRTRTRIAMLNLVASRLGKIKGHWSPQFLRLYACASFT